MIDASLPDLFRLLVVPAFLWAAYTDIKTRRIPNAVWKPLYVLGVGLIVWELLTLQFGTIFFRLYAIKLAISVLVVGGMGIVFWVFGAFGGADAKAFIALGLLFPTFPTYTVQEVTLPAITSNVDVFSLTIVTNAVLLAAVFPLALLIFNLRSGHVGLISLIAKRVEVTELSEQTGRIVNAGGKIPHGMLDLDALRMYLQWRRTDLGTLQDDPRTRNPDSVPDERGHVGDGSIPDMGEVDVVTQPTTEDWDYEDEWAAELFLEEIDSTAYGTSAEELRDGLDRMVSEESVWVSPGMPFIVPIAIGLVVSFFIGDLMSIFLQGFVG